MDNDKNTQLLLTLVSSLASQAWIQMGKIKNPVTDKIERNIDAASITIDMLTMLKDKTSNNTSDDEKNFIEHSLRDLQMNFIAEKGKGAVDIFHRDVGCGAFAHLGPFAPEEFGEMADPVRDHGLDHACWALLNSSEFLYSP